MRKEYSFEQREAERIRSSRRIVRKEYLLASKEAEQIRELRAFAFILAGAILVIGLVGCLAEVGKRQNNNDVLRSTYTASTSINNSNDANLPIIFKEFVGVQISDTYLQDHPSIHLVDANNCGGVDTDSYEVSQTTSIVAEVNVSTSINAGVDSFVVAGIEREYSFVEGEELISSSTITINAPPNTHLKYAIIWSRIWVEGVAIIKDVDDQLKSIPFEATTGVTGRKIVEKNIGCPVGY